MTDIDNTLPPAPGDPIPTTTIALETSKGDLPFAIGLGMVLIAIVIAINALAWGTRRFGERMAG